MITEIKGKCQWDGCELDAQLIAGGRDYGSYAPSNLYCEEHAKLRANEGNPEYHTNCPNCGCLFGVN